MENYAQDAYIPDAMQGKRHFFTFSVAAWLPEDAHVVYSNEGASSHMDLIGRNLPHFAAGTQSERHHQSAGHHT